MTSIADLDATNRPLFAAPDPTTIPIPTWAEEVDEFEWVGLPDVWRRQAIRRFAECVILWAWQDVDAAGTVDSQAVRIDVFLDQVIDTPQAAREVASAMAAAADALATVMGGDK